MSFLSAVKGELGSESNPLTTTADISNNEFSGIEPLFVDFGGQLSSPIEIDMLFGESGGPYYVISFSFTDNKISGNSLSSNTPNATRFNNTVSGSGYSSSGSGIEKGNQNFNLNIDGNKFYRDYFDDSKRLNQSDLGATESSPSSAEFEVKYYNHATQTLLSTSEAAAMRTHINVLSDKTPHVAMEADSDGGRNSNIDFGSSFGTSGTGHLTAFQANNNHINLQPRVSPGSDNSSGFAWTHNSNVSSDTDGSISSSIGIQDVSTDCIMPESVYHYVGSGGGSCVGTPYQPSFNTISDNKKNNRTFFLVKD